LQGNLQSGLPTTIKLPRATWHSAATNKAAHGAPNALTLDVELQQLLPLDVELLPLQLPPPWSAKLLLLIPLDIEILLRKLAKIAGYKFKTSSDLQCYNHPTGLSIAMRVEQL